MHHIVAIPIDKSLAEFIGKKGSENGITFYDRKSDSDVIVALMPTDTQEKPYSIAESMLLAEQIVLSTASIDRSFGEMLVASSLLGKHVLITDENDIGNLLAGGVLRDFEIVGKEALLERILAKKTEQKEGRVRIDIDKAFPVHGVGTVALGIVTGGVVRVHDVLQHSSGKKATVRSIQSQDVDVKEAGMQTRVGLALKGIEHDEIEKGDILSSEPVAKSMAATAELKVSEIAKESVSDATIYQFVSNFSHTNARLKQSGGEFSISFEKPVCVLPGDSFILIRSRQPRLFASGVVKTVRSA